jgi:hypothetical protein
MGAANLKLSPAATSAAFVFSEAGLENWRLAKSLTEFSRHSGYDHESDQGEMNALQMEVRGRVGLE